MNDILVHVPNFTLLKNIKETHVHIKYMYKFDDSLIILNKSSPTLYSYFRLMSILAVLRKRCLKDLEIV